MKGKCFTTVRSWYQAADIDHGPTMTPGEALDHLRA